MFPHWGMESRQVMSPSRDLLPAHCTTALTRVLSKELSVKSFSSLSAPEEGPFTSSQGSPLRTVQLESENSFAHLPSPQSVCHSAFSTRVQSFDSTQLMTHNITYSQLYYSIFATTLRSFEARTWCCTVRTDKL